MRWPGEQKFKIVGHHIWDTTRCDPIALRSQMRTAASVFIRRDSAPVPLNVVTLLLNVLLDEIGQVGSAWPFATKIQSDELRGGQAAEKLEVLLDAAGLVPKEAHLQCERQVLAPHGFLQRPARMESHDGILTVRQLLN